MDILLTGAGGMVGQHILAHSEARQYHFCCPDKQTLDLTDPHQVRDFFRIYRPELIIHAAGKVGGIQANLNNPVEFLLENMQMGLNVLSIAAEFAVPKLINLASSCMYPRDSVAALSEEMILSGALEPSNEAYALAKISVTRLCEYYQQHDSRLAYKTVIPCNLYGAHDKFSGDYAHMIPAVIDKIAQAQAQGKQVVHMWGDGLARREFMHAEDFADFIFYALKHFEQMPQNINVGLGRDYRVREYYEFIACELGFSGEIVADLSRPSGMAQKLMDISRLHTFGWSSSITLKEGIAKTVQAYHMEDAR